MEKCPSAGTSRGDRDELGSPSGKNHPDHPQAARGGGDTAQGAETRAVTWRESGVGCAPVCWGSAGPILVCCTGAVLETAGTSVGAVLEQCWAHTGGQCWGSAGAVLGVYTGSILVCHSGGKAGPILVGCTGTSAGGSTGAVLGPCWQAVLGLSCGRPWSSTVPFSLRFWGALAPGLRSMLAPGVRSVQGEGKRRPRAQLLPGSHGS